MLLQANPHECRFSRSLAVLVCSATLTLATSCSPESVNITDHGPTGVALEAAVAEHFGQVAAPLLQRPSQFTLTQSADEYVGPTPTDWQKGLLVTVPVKADAPVRFQAPDGFTLDVWDDGRRGTAEGTSRTVSYARQEGTAIWKAADGYAEQWLYLPDGVVGRDVASYLWQGGEPRQHGRSIDIYDDAGKARITVSAPDVLTPEGEHLSVAMELRGERMWVVLEKVAKGPLLVDPVWVPAGDMGLPRFHHASQMLQDGRVLVVGGITDPLADGMVHAELFDPMTDTWSFVASMAKGRQSHTLTALDDGRVLAVGGEEAFPSIDAEIYDPVNDAWTVPDQPIGRRISHTATLLLDGRVLVAGGTTNAPQTAEIYDPVVDDWTSTSLMVKNRQGHLAVRLSSGDVFVSEGTGDTSAEVYSPSADLWSARVSGVYGHGYTNPVLVSDGTVIYAGGTLSGGVERYDPVADSWTTLAPSNVVRRDCPAVLLPNDQVYSIGGSPSAASIASTEVYDVAANLWNFGAPLNVARSSHLAHVLNDGRVLVLGGFDPPNALNSCELLVDSQSDLGAPCAKNNECASFVCFQGMCCDKTCDQPCYTHKAAEGSPQDGVCAPSVGIACDDGDLCTTQDTCTVGVCVGTTTDCPDVGECIFGYCEERTGECKTANRPVLTPCSEGWCKNGVCVSGEGGAGGAGQGGMAEGGGGVGGVGGQGLGGSGGFGGSGGSGGMASSSSSSGGFDGISPTGGCQVGYDSRGKSLWILLLGVLGIRRQAVAPKQRQSGC